MNFIKSFKYMVSFVTSGSSNEFIMYRGHLGGQGNRVGPRVIPEHLRRLILHPNTQREGGVQQLENRQRGEAGNGNPPEELQTDSDSDNGLEEQASRSDSLSEDNGKPGENATDNEEPFPIGGAPEKKNVIACVIPEHLPLRILVPTIQKEEEVQRHEVRHKGDPGNGNPQEELETDSDSDNGLEEQASRSDSLSEDNGKPGENATDNEEPFPIGGAPEKKNVIACVDDTQDIIPIEGIPNYPILDNNLVRDINKKVQNNRNTELPINYRFNGSLPKENRDITNTRSSQKTRSSETKVPPGYLFRDTVTGKDQKGKTSSSQTNRSGEFTVPLGYLFRDTVTGKDQKGKTSSLQKKRSSEATKEKQPWK